MVQPVGPMWPGGFETIVTTKDGRKYEVLFLPDLHNDELQAEGKAPVYYWLPNGIRIARDGDTGPYKFRLTHFVGVQSADTTVGVAGTREVAGGVLAFTVTMAPPLGVLEAAQQQLTDRLRGDQRKYWGWRIPSAPQFMPIEISDSRTHMSNLSPNADGEVPSQATPSPTNPAPAPAPANPGAPGAPRSVPAIGRDSRAIQPRLVPSPPAVRADRDVSPQGLDAWYMRIEGDGPGSMKATDEKAYVALCGSLPTAILWAGFHGTYSPVVVSQTMNLALWSETCRIKIDGDWDRVFQHFSAAANGRAWWFSADIKAEFNNLRISGGITVDVEIDGTRPGADKMKEAVDKRIDLIVDKFTEQAKARIFEPAPPEVKPAEASSGGGILSSLFGGFGGGFALKYRRDETKLDIHYNEIRKERFNKPTTISSSLEGFFTEIKNDPDAEQKYFVTLYLEDWDRKIIHNVKPVVNWPDVGRRWVGEPVSFLACQIGYPSASGDIQWTPHVFQSTDTTPQTTWQPAFAKKNAADVTNAPAGWTPDVSYIKRSVHFTEPPSETDNPYVRCFVEKDVIDLDPDENGTATNELNLEVRADSTGKLDVGPIGINALLDGPAQTVEVEMQAYGRTDDGNERPVIRFQFNSADQNEARYWSIFTGQRDFRPAYRYRVHVLVKGSIFSKGLEWWGDWTETSGNGPVMLTVPTADEAVQVRRTVPSERPPAQIEAAPASAPPAGAPPKVVLTPARPAGPPAGSPAGRPRMSEGSDTPTAAGSVQGYPMGGSPRPSGGGPGVVPPLPPRSARDGEATTEPAALALVPGWQRNGH